MPASVVGTPATAHGSNASSFSHNFDIDASCELAIIYVRHGQNTNNRTHSAVTLNGDAASMLSPGGADNYLDASVTNPSRRRMSVWTITNPDTGTGLAVAGSFSDTVAQYSVTVIQFGANGGLGAISILESQAPPTTPFPYDTSITPTDADSVILYSVMTNAGTADPFAIADSTDTELQDHGTSSNHSSFVGTGDVVSVGNPQTMGVNGTAGNDWCAIAIEVLPAAGGDIPEASGSVVGEGVLTAVGHVDMKASGSVAGEGELTATGHVQMRASFSVVGEGELTAAGSAPNAIPEASFAVQGDGELSATGHVQKKASGSVAAEGEVAAAGHVDMKASGSVQGEGALSAVGEAPVVAAIPSASFVVQGVGGLTAVGFVTPSPTFKAPGRAVRMAGTGLWRFYDHYVAHCVWIDPEDTVHESATPLDWDLKNAKPGSGDFGNSVFRRGRTYAITSAERSLLEAAGYTVNE